MHIHRLAFIAAALAAITAFGQPDKPDAKAAQKAAKDAAERLKARQKRPDNDAIAARLVRDVAIRAGDIVLIRGESPDQELLEDIAVAVRARSATPVLKIASDRLNQRLYDDVPPAMDAEVDPIDALLATQVTAIISIDGGHSPGALNHIPAARIAARAKNRGVLDQLMIRRGVRRLSLGRDLYPSAATANRYALGIDELDRAFWFACSADMAPLKDISDAVAQQLTYGKEVAISGPNGTSLKFRIDRRPAFVNDGIITEDEAKRGGAACFAWLPAGEVYISVVPGTADGKLVCDSLSFGGREIQNLTINFKAGRITSMNARSGLEPLRRLYEASGPGKDLLGWLDIGLNPDIAVPRGTKPLCLTPAGMVTLGIGGNLWAGGDNAEAFELPLYLPGCSVKIDGSPLVKDGTLAPTPVLSAPLLMP